MKRAKFALTAIAVFAVVGGALAFKANRTANQFYRTTVLGGNCTSATTVLYTATPNGNPAITQSTYYTTPVAGACPTLVIYSAD
jgi:hypothetical protein